MTSVTQALTFSPVRRRLVGLVLWLLASVLVVQHPLHPAWIVTSLVLYLVGLMRYPRAWLIIVPAALPLLDLSLWSGRFLYDEYDLLLLATLGKLFWSTRSPRALHFTLLWPYSWLIHGFLLTTLISLGMALWPVQPPGPEAWYSFLSPWNGLRVAKGCLYAWLLWPFIRETLQQAPQEALLLLATGLLAGLAGCGLAILWERGVLDALFNWRGFYQILEQLLDFSGSYRVTGLFSSMRVGGSAIDGYLVVTMPFAIATALLGPNLRVRIAGAGVLALGLYALLVTFTRTTYLAGAVGCLIMLASLPLLSPAHWKQHASFLLGSACYALLAAAGMAMAYHWGGYEALTWATAWTLGTVAIGLQLARVPRRVLLLLAAAISTVLALLLAAAFQESRHHQLPPERLWLVATGLALFLVPWGMLIGYLARSRGLGRQVPGAALVTLLIITGVIGMSGGARMQERFSETHRDLLTRIAHWRDSLDSRSPGLLHFLFGEGSGSYPSLYQLAHLARGSVQGLSSYRYLSKGTTSWLRLGPGDFNIAQRIALEPDTHYRLRLRARTAMPIARAKLNLGLCPKHILYARRWQPRCLRHSFDLKGDGKWQELQWEFESDSLGWGRPWKWPVTLLLNQGSSVEIDITDLSLVDLLFREHIVNGNFAHHGDHWFFVNDFDHLSWHSKQLYIHLWLEQGWIGLGLFLLGLVLGVRHQLRALRNGVRSALPVLGALSGLAVLGLTSTVIDDSHTGLLVYLLLFSALQWPPHQPAPTPKPERKNSGVLLLPALILAGAGLAFLHLPRNYRNGLEQVFIALRQESGLRLPAIGRGKRDLPFSLDILRRDHPRIVLPGLAHWDGRGRPQLMRTRELAYHALGIIAPPPCQGNGMLPRTACWVATGNPVAGIDALRMARGFRIRPANGSGNYGNAWELALSYDLLYRHPAMTPDLRHRIEQRLANDLRNTLNLLNRPGPSLWHGRSTLAANAWLTASVLDPDLTYLRPLIRDALYHFREVLKALHLTEGWPEGYNYWINSRAFPISLAAAAYINTVRSPEERQWAGRILSRTGRWMLYATRPDGRIEGFGDEGPRTDLKDETRRSVDIMAQATRDPVLSTFSLFLQHLHKTEGYWRGYRWGFWLFNDPAVVPLCSPQAPSLKCLNGRLPTAELFGRDAFNQAFIRSGWGADATFISFRAGSTFTHHGHYDAGHFTLFRGGPLIVNSSTYQGNILSPNRLYYAIRGVAKNTLLVLRPGETVRPNRFFTENVVDGGPRIVLPTGSDLRSVADWHRNLNAGLHLEGGRILHFTHVEGDYTYIAADLTGAYDSPAYDVSGTGGKVERMIRELLYLHRQDRLIIHDRVRTTRSGLITKSLLHLPERPAIDGLHVVRGSSMNGILEGSTGEGWVMTDKGGVSMIFLEPADGRLRLIGGPDYRYYVEVDGDDKSLDGHNFDEGTAVKPWFDPAPWRIEYEPVRQRRIGRFLLVLSPLPARKGEIELRALDGQSPGLLLDDTLVIYADGNKEVTRSFVIPPAVKLLVIAGLAQDTRYEVIQGNETVSVGNSGKSGIAVIEISRHGMAMIHLHEAIHDRSL